MTPNPSMSLQLAGIPAGGYDTTVSQDEITPQSGVSQTTDSQLPNTTVAATPKTFPRFKELPAELRKAIWELSLSQPRVFWPNDERAGKYFTGVNFAHKPPAMRQVCQESRQVSQARGGFTFGHDESIMEGLWFDYFSNILYMFCNCSREGYTIAIRNTRNVALIWPDVWVLRDLQRLKRFMVEYPKCRRILLIVASDMDPWSDMETFLIQGEIPIDYAPEDWGRLKDSLERSWRKKSALRCLGVIEAQLPKIETMVFESIYDENEVWPELSDE
ncbi:uncharacterized protein FTOL_06422 [Fusarium torulosum]|uniref:2EXR domain-containing protein n=1 Tax=Fusarium torulosum TaxID=33205 RepID=A0AAE8M9U1_9HYPO|nr:uncharacterized protein FTOL_06422 [Fusarium torulosum]